MAIVDRPVAETAAGKYKWKIGIIREVRFLILACCALFCVLSFSFLISRYAMQGRCPCDRGGD